MLLLSPASRVTQPAQFPSLTAAGAALPPARPLHLALGMFDGVHLGHRAVIDAAVHSARRNGGLAAVLTFWPHPSALFRPDARVRLIMDAATRARALLALGVDVVITQPFTPEFARITAEEFLTHVRSHLPQLAGVHAGENFRFGHSRRGDIALLVGMGRQLGVQVFSAPRVNFNDEPISSSRIRASLATGEIAIANAMLGRTYTADGLVASGQQLGRTLGFPTLNLPWSPDSCPRLGVYAVRVTSEKSPRPLNAVANYGLRPTVEAAATAPLLETHILGDCPFSGGDWISVEWLHFLRPERKFPDLADLREQITRDREAAAKYFAG
ncbi:MAG: riboflavin biosynthesis protein RibF [Verrucomicrobiota bacterium]